MKSRKNPIRRPRKNAGAGLRFTFHGRFKSKKDAVAREKQTPGAFIREKNGYYLVMTERKPGTRTNPRRRRRAVSGRSTLKRPIPNRAAHRRRRVNPPAGHREIYHRLGILTAQKGPGHKCDSKCAKANHWYKHTFTRGSRAYQLPDGDVRLRWES